MEEKTETSSIVDYNEETKEATIKFKPKSIVIVLNESKIKWFITGNDTMTEDEMATATMLCRGIVHTISQYWKDLIDMGVGLFNLERQKFQAQMEQDAKDAQELSDAEMKKNPIHIDLSKVIPEGSA